MKMNIIMGAAKPLDQEITHYLGHLSTEQKKVVLSVVKSFAREEEAWADDKAYIAEMDKRFNELEAGKVKGLTIDELAGRVRQAYKNRKRRKS
jgi:putative addiction module component (TIGR02574 family)